MTRFTAADVERAYAEWRCSCGPAVLAAICDLTLDEVRSHVGAEFPGCTNPTRMFQALQSIGRPWQTQRDRAWPRCGLCRIPWEGPWTEPGVNLRWEYRHTHWVGAAHGDGCVLVFDVNQLVDVFDGWRSAAWWSRTTAALLIAGILRASRRSYIAHSIEVEQR